MTCRLTIPPLLATALLAAGAAAQDSVPKTGCLPGDGVRAYSDASTAGGSEQSNAYVVDLSPFNTSWGTTFGIAPLIKSSKVSINFTGSLLSSQAMSRRLLVDVPTSKSQYMVWGGAGFGVNNDASINDPGTMLSTTGLLTNQFSVAFSEFSNTSQGFSYNGIVGGIVNVVPTRPSRLYVNRVAAAINGCDEFGNVSQVGLGSVDAAGNLFFRADGFGTTGSSPSCSTLNNLVGDNLFKVRMAARNASVVNVISNDYLAGGLFDKGGSGNTTEWLVRGATTTMNTPGVLPVPGGTPLLLGTTTTLTPASLFLRGPAFGAITANSAHLAPGVSEHRGNVSYTSSDFAPLGSSSGIAAVLGLDTAGNATILNLFGLDAAGNVTGTLALTLPATVIDNSTGYVNIPGTNEFDHYKSQVAFRGGNGQVAMGLDQEGDLLVAAEVVMPDDSLGANWGWNYLAVARVHADGSPTAWTMAAYCDGTIYPAAQGKPVLDGPGGTELARLVEFTNITGGGGPSLSAPMIDSVGNVWFIGAIMYPNFDVRTALLRAVYDPATFSYQLERVLQTGQRFRGRNSDRNWLITYFSIADSNSVSSSTSWSQNISEDAHLGRSPAGLAPRDPRSLGGLVVNAGVLYDWNDDGNFSNCTGDPTSPDMSYNALLYVGYPGYSIRRTENRPANQHQ